MNDCVQNVLAGLRGDASCIARDIGLERLLRHDGRLVENNTQAGIPSAARGGLRAAPSRTVDHRTTGETARRANVVLYRPEEMLVVHPLCVPTLW